MDRLIRSACYLAIGLMAGVFSANIAAACPPVVVPSCAHVSQEGTVAVLDVLAVPYALDVCAEAICGVAAVRAQESHAQTVVRKQAVRQRTVRQPLVRRRSRSFTLQRTVTR